MVLAITSTVAFVACGDNSDDKPPSGTGGSGGSGGKGGSSSGGKGGSTSSGGKGGGSSSGGKGGSGGGSNSSAGKGGSGGGSNSSGGKGGSGGQAGVPDNQGGTGNVPSGECDLSGEGLPTETLPTDIDSDLELTNDKVWIIEGFVKIHPGATLKIPACTRLEGTEAPNPGVLVAMRGGRLEAVGTADEPILFTTQKPPGSRAEGQWGGVVLLGRAKIGAGTPTKIYEGLTDDDYTYGGTNDEDDSGILQYVRIEFGGYEILPDKEVNGLSMGAVGSGTTIDHIMVTNTSDDCYEWWGGSVRADYLICNNAGDDMFDTDEGYLGGGQHWFGRRTTVGVISSLDPNGFEWDGTEGGVTLEPVTHVTATDVTLCGTGEPIGEGGGSSPEYGMVLRELVTGDIDDLALLGFEYGIDARDNFQADQVTIKNSVFFGLGNAVGAPDVDDNDGMFDDATIFTGDASNELDPDPLPFTLDQCNAQGGPSSEVLESDIGAFAGDADWMKGAWVDWAED